jgi:aminoglycoside phosphotransferase (APT) family kinase protein
MHRHGFILHDAPMDEHGPAVEWTDPDSLTISTRTAEELRVDLERWLVGRTGDAAAAITNLDRPSANGMSSETVLFDASWTDDAGEHSGAFVARLRPAADAYPIFQDYDLGRQARVIRLVGENTSVPVPEVVFDEPSDAHLGSPFFVMRRIDGLVPPDVMPYPMGSWVTEATDEQRELMEHRAVEVLAGIHSAAKEPADLAFLEFPEPGDSALRRHVAHEREYYEWARDGLQFPLLERAFDWLDDNWPVEADSMAPVVSWGDARIGNMMFRDFEPVGVLDWEMAGVAPRELDVGWMIFLHRFFQDLCDDMELPGLPEMFRPERVAAHYTKVSGYEPVDLDWFVTYGALRHGIVMTRAIRRGVHFGDQEMPADPDDLVLHRRSLEALLDGTYWDRI